MPPTTAKQVDFLMSGITDVNGSPLSGGKVFAFDAGSNTPRDTWIDADKNTLSVSPIVLDSRGTSLTFADGDYKFIIQDSNDVVIYTRDFEFYGSQGIGEFYITDDPSSGVPGAPGELVTGDGTDGGGGGGGSGAQVTDDGSVNSPAIACGDSVPCVCGCCFPDSYRVTLGGQTGLFSDFNGVWIVKRSGGRIGLYHKETPAGLITLDLNGIDCLSLTIIAGDLVDTATIGDLNLCTSSGSVGALTWDICPFSSKATSIVDIEVTFVGITACTGCIDKTPAPFRSYNNIVLNSIVNSTFTLDQGGCASWSTGDLFSDPMDVDQFNGLGCGGSIITPGTDPPSIKATVDIVGSTITVILNGQPGGVDGFIFFRGTSQLISGQNNCVDTLGILNDIDCGEVGLPGGKGGLASINWVP